MMAYKLGDTLIHYVHGTDFTDVNHYVITGIEETKVNLKSVHGDDGSYVFRVRLDIDLKKAGNNFKIISVGGLPEDLFTL